ncbi:MAG: polyprenyl synthetase family protein [Acidimicrobiales bacterium]
MNESKPQTAAHHRDRSVVPEFSNAADMLDAESGVAAGVEPEVRFDAVRRAVDMRLDGLLRLECERWCEVDADLRRGFDLLRAFISGGGKRLRPAFAFWGFVGSGGDPADERIVELGAALEMLHTFALVHDDVMDGSLLRRHAPTIHSAFQGDHDLHRWRGEPRRFGEGMAVLLGDLAFVYSDLLASDLPKAVRSGFHDLKVELHVGQYLDLWGAAQHEPNLDRARQVIRYKTARYSAERPLLLGATLAADTPIAADMSRLHALREFGLAVGEAFQLRDDILGAFGDPAVTGKPIGDDFREGKQTILAVFTSSWASGDGERLASRAALAALDRLGAPDLSEHEIGLLQGLVESSGARSHVEGRIAELMHIAEQALPAACLGKTAEVALRSLAHQAAWRTA